MTITIATHGGMRKTPGWLVSCLAAFFLVACSGGSSDDGPAIAQADAIPAAASAQPLDVPPALAGQVPQDRTLTVPAGFGIRVWAVVNRARFMTLAPNGDVLVSVPSEGRILLLRPRANDIPQQFELASGLRSPHDMVFRNIDGTTWLYVAESYRVTRTAWQDGQTRLAGSEVVVDNLPDSFTAGLFGSYGHELKNIAIGPDNKLYVSIASSCNACAEDVTADPVRGAIYQYDADGANGRLFASGLRNAEGLDFIPGTNTLWVAVNNRDDVRVPFDRDVDGDGQSDLGQIVTSYVDANPPDPFNSVRAGANYGWPFCNGVPNDSMSNIELVPDFELNRDNAVFDCNTATRAEKAFAAHSAPLGLSFLHDSAVPPVIRQGAAVALHGCWNCSGLKAGYKVVFVPFDAAGNPGSETDLVSGFVVNPETREVWGRPVDVIADAQGNLLVSDDYANLIYQLYPR